MTQDRNMQLQRGHLVGRC